jgi:Fe-S-cluster containining protein
MGFAYPRSVRFRCDRCALCCGDTESKIRKIVLLEPEAQHIAKETSRPIRGFAERLEGSEPYVYRIKKTRRGKCTFLKGSTCSIYRIRPLVCVFYPFELKTNPTGSHVFSYTDECPCIGRGAELKRKYFERLFKKSSALVGRGRVART